VQDLTPIKIDLDIWQIWEQNETYIYIFFPPVQKTFPRHYVSDSEVEVSTATLTRRL